MSLNNNLMPCFNNIVLGFSPHPMVKYFLIFALTLSMMMAIFSSYNAHPDEHHHFLAAQYYMDHWLPPEIGDPAVRNSYSVWGASYLDYYWVEYLFLGKSAAILSLLVEKPLTAVRLTNVSLFLILILFFFQRAKTSSDELIIPSLLLITPQVWYIFSYVNNDAFALFLSLLVISEFTYQQSFLHQFLNSESVFGFFQGGILFGLLLGLLSISKQNYYVLLLFIGFLFVYTSITFNFQKTSPQKIIFKKQKIFKYLLILLIAFSIFFTRYAVDIIVNGESNFVARYLIGLIVKNDQPSKLLAYQEEIAEAAFKPSLLNKDLRSSHFSLRLRDKGLSYQELFSKWFWHTKSFYSFVGQYGWLSVSAPMIYYYSMVWIYSAFLIFLIVSIVMSRDRRAIFLGMIGLLTIGIVIFASMYHSWVNAFQAQGRYLFPAISLIGFIIYENRKYFNSLIMNGFLLSLFLMSAYSFLFVALYRMVATC